MKKCWLLLFCVLLLSGCSVKETFETVLDNHDISPAAYAVEIAFPEEAVIPSMEASDGSKIYMCDDFTVTVQTLAGEDINQTFQEITGCPKEALTIMQTKKDGLDRYACAWSTAGEGEDQICRAVILDDGTYHYGVTVMANYSKAGELTEKWQEILDSVSLNTD